MPSCRRRFRAGNIVHISDVEKAFLQVFLHEDDRDLTRVLWLKDFNKPPTIDNLVVYRFTRVLFGLNVSPFLLAAVILYHLRSVEDKSLAKQMPHSLYVDNLILTTDLCPDEAVEIYKKIKQIFKDMNMNIREFLSNSKEFNEKIDEKDRASEVITKVLGIPWNSEEDIIQVQALMETLEEESRSTISGTIAGNFDPLGLLVPLLLPAKIFQRDYLWETHYDWKTIVLPDVKEKWAKVVGDISGFYKEIPRNVIAKSSNNQLLTFCDASKEAVAYCIYAINELGVNLLFGKSQVRPKKEQWTIPKLETHALMLGATKSLQVYKALRLDEIKVQQVMILTDSTIALDWLRASPLKKEAGVLVTRRLQQIRTVVMELEEEGVRVSFGHVRSEQNPADLGTRGCDKTTFGDSIWWKGPEFAQGNVEEWSKELNLFQLGSDTTMCLIQTNSADEDQVFDYRVTNRYRKMIRVVGQMMRILKYSFRNIPTESMKILETRIPAIKAATFNEKMEAEELHHAEILLLRDHQKSITKEQRRKYINLGMKKNMDGLWICKGRMGNSELKDDAKFPILVLPYTRLSIQIIDDSHKPYHLTADQTMDRVRRRFWIPQLRRQVQKYFKTCVPCQRWSKQTALYPDMAPLPGKRVNRTRPFANTGLDNFGPIVYIKEDGTEGSGIGVIFTCAVTRLVHVELSRDSSALQFLYSFQRFGALRGFPDNVISDNGTNFVLSQKIVEEAFRIHDPQRELQHINWKFITALSPWKGGFYERLVKAVKHTLFKANGKKKLSWDELQMVLYEIAAAVNSRPLTYLENDINAEMPIRPQDFINQVQWLDNTDDNNHNPLLSASRNRGIQISPKVPYQRTIIQSFPEGPGASLTRDHTDTVDYQQGKRSSDTNRVFRSMNPSSMNQEINRKPPGNRKEHHDNREVKDTIKLK